MTYLIPKRMKEQVKLFHKPFTMYMLDAGFMFVFALTGWLLASQVDPHLWIPYGIYVGLSAIYLTRPAKDNPGKRRWQAILYLLVRLIGKPWYKSIDNPKRGVHYEKAE
jgi:hypothetical protein